MKYIGDIGMTNRTKARQNSQLKAAGLICLFNKNMQLSLGNKATDIFFNTRN